MKAKSSTHYIMQNPLGGWDVKRGGALRVSRRFNTKKEAEAAGRKISKSQGTELIVYKEDNRK